MTDLDDKLTALGVDEEIRQLVLTVAGRTACRPYERTRDGKSVPCVAEQSGQVALYPMRRRIAIALEPDVATHWAQRTGGGLERKTPRTWYVHLSSVQLADEDVRSAAVEASLLALETVGRRTGRSADEGAAGEPRSWGSCSLHGMAQDAYGCPTCRGE